MISTTYLKTKKKYKVTFTLPEEQVGEGRDVRVLGSFNDWSWDGGLQLKNGKKGYSAATEIGAGDYQFRYLIDGHHWINDDSADSYTDSGQGTTNCCLSLAEVKEETKAKEKAAPKAEAKAKAKEAPKAKAKAAPAKKAASKAKADDLKKIEGIGPKIAGLLQDEGIKTFSDLAKATDKQLADVLQAAGARFRLAKYDTWAKQAKLAAAGKMDELKELQGKLK